jgi:hypothetical protein
VTCAGAPACVLGSKACMRAECTAWALAGRAGAPAVNASHASTRHARNTHAAHTQTHART